MIEKFVKPEVEVTAVQYSNNAECVLEIFHWLNGVFHIQRGEDHELRRFDELNEKGTALWDASPFLVIRTRSGEDRVNEHDWIVKYDEERISVYSPLDFAYNFTGVMN